MIQKHLCLTLVLILISVVAIAVSSDNYYTHTISACAQPLDVPTNNTENNTKRTFEIFGTAEYEWINFSAIRITWKFIIWDKETHEPLGSNVVFRLYVIIDNETVFLYEENLTETNISITHIFIHYDYLRPFCFNESIEIYDPSNTYASIKSPPRKYCIHPNRELFPTNEPSLSILLLASLLILLLQRILKGVKN